MNERLPAKVRAVNRANARALTLYDELTKVFRPLVGTKVIKTDGELRKSVADIIPPLERFASISVHRYSSDYNIMYVVKTCEMVSEYTCLYHEMHVRIGSLDGSGVLTEINPPPQLRVDYSVDEVVSARAKYEALKREADKVFSPYYLFESESRVP